MPYKNHEDLKRYKRERRKRIKEEQNKRKSVILSLSPNTKRCGHEECNTVLSKYNTENYCAIHAPAYNLKGKQSY